ncbi:hypothetical protein SAMN04488072_108106 [Lentibacillus halodurans]|uniref:PQQ-like domain-containing protein n=1 Tax=Lentibacillus halodurans TaxID=237679 RepID=A0A1I0YS14_9BACI|nr:PQQ-binding-like beta-propeller repeat protein [Lentibacillus halodurans]SFB15606.1 hypothetical protein SAMN04488072_108106 [Lentibacillus halodurans]
MKKIVILVLMLVFLYACGEEPSNGAYNDTAENNGAASDKETQEVPNKENDDEAESVTEDETQNTAGNVTDMDIDSVYEAIVQNDFLNDDTLEMNNANLDWFTFEFMSLANKSITVVDNTAYFSNNQDTYPLNLKDNSFADEIDEGTDVQIVQYDGELLFLHSDNDQIYMHYLNKDTEEIADTVEFSKAKDTDDIANTYLYEDKLIGVTGYVGNIYIFDLSTNSLEEVIDMEEVLGERRDLNTIGFDDGLLYIGAEGLSSSIYALDVTSGELSWDLELGEDSLYTMVGTYQKEPIFVGDSMHIHLENKAYLEIDKNTGELLNAAEFGVRSHLLHATEENIYMVHENTREEEEYIVSLNKDTLEPNWAVAIDGRHKDFAATVNDNYLYTAVLNHTKDPGGTDWYKIDMDTGEILKKDYIEELNNQNAEGLFFEIIEDKMILADGFAGAISQLE